MNRKTILWGILLFSTSLFAKSTFSIPKSVVKLPGFVVDTRSWIELPHFVSNPDYQTLTYRVRTHLPFTTLENGDLVRLVPLPGDEGRYSIEVEVSEGSVFKLITFQFEIKGHDFKWKDGNKWMPKAVVGKSFGFHIAPFTEGQYRHVRLIEGPRWLNLITLSGSKPGVLGNVLQGGPSTDESGPYSVTLELESQDGTKTEADIVGSVVYAFPYDSRSLAPTAQAHKPYSLDLSDVAESPICSAMEWEIAGMPHWLRVKNQPLGTLEGTGALPILYGTPTRRDLITYKIEVKQRCSGNKPESKTEVLIPVVK